jgi:hypothetical protein
VRAYDRHVCTDIETCLWDYSDVIAAGWFVIGVLLMMVTHQSMKYIILIANFDGDDERYKVTQTVINRMKRAIDH